MADEDQDKSQKTEQPTAHRIEKAREKGQVAVSKELGNWFAFLAFLIIFYFMIPSAFSKLSTLLSVFIANAGMLDISGSLFGGLINQTLLSILIYLTAPALILIVFGIASSLSQTQFLISFESIKPSFEKISLMKGLKKIFSVKSLVELLKNVLKLVAVATISIIVVWPEIDTLLAMSRGEIGTFLSSLQSLFIRLIIAVFSNLTFLALLDYGYQKFNYIRDLMMSHQEIKEEMKEIEGDPHVKSRQRRLRSERNRQRIAKDVPEATVVITNPTHFAIALKYDHNSTNAPIVVAKGADYLAKRIREIAKEHGVPLYENPPLARTLYDNLEVGQEIPYEYYEAVAKIIRHVMNLGKTA